MADDTAALVLSLEARFDKFEKAMQEATAVVDKQTKIIEGRFDQMTKVIGGKLDAIKGTFVAQAGLLGAALSALGPIGVAAAVGIGLLSEALNATAEAAGRVGEKAVALRQFSQNTGIGIEQAQGFRKAFRELGIDSDQAQKAIQLFSISLNELRKTGGGPLREALDQLDTGLAAQMLQTRDTNEAVLLFIRSLSRLTAEQRNAAARSSAGRTGIEFFGEAAADADKFIDLVEKGTAAAKKNRDEIELQVAVYKRFVAAQKEAQAAKDAAFPTTEFMIAKTREAEAWTKVWERFAMGGGFAALKEGLSSSPIGKLVTAFKTGDFSEFFADKAGNAEKAQKTLRDIGIEALKSGQGVKKLGESFEFDPTAQLDDRKKQLQAVNAEIIRLQQLQQASGPAFSPQDAARLQQLLLAQKELNLARDPALLAARKRGEQEYADQLTLQTIAIKERLGVATEEDEKTKNRIELVHAERDAKLDASQKATAALIKEKETREKLNEQIVRASNLPGLTRLAQDFNNASKQIDQFAVSAFGKMEDSFADVITGTKNFKDAFKDMTNSILRDLIKLALRRALFGPLLNALGAGTGFAGIPLKAAGGPVSGGQPYIVGEKGPELFIPSVGGAIAPNSTISGGTMNVNISLAGAMGDRAIQQIAFATTQAGMAAALQQVPRIATAAVADATRRGTF